VVTKSNSTWSTLSKVDKVERVVLAPYTLATKDERNFDILATKITHFRQSRPQQTVEFDFVASVYGRATKLNFMNINKDLLVKVTALRSIQSRNMTDCIGDISLQ